MKEFKRYREGEPIPDEAKLIRDEIVQEPLSSSELSEMGWPGLGPWPERTIRYLWYEVPCAVMSSLKCKHPGCACVCGHQGKCPEDGPIAAGETYD